MDRTIGQGRLFGSDWSSRDQCRVWEDSRCRRPWQCNSSNSFRIDNFLGTMAEHRETHPDHALYLDSRRRGHDPVGGPPRGGYSAQPLHSI